MIEIQTPDFPRIAYEKQGTGPAVLLLHGFPENSGLWHNIIPSLSVRYTVIAPDIPGAGKSPMKGQETSMEESAKSIHAIVEHEQLKELVIAGHSMGGYIALAYAEKYGSTLRGLSLVHSTAAPDSEERKELRRRAIDLVKKGNKQQFLKGAIPNMFSEAFNKRHADIIEQQIERGTRLPDESIIAYYKAMAARPDRHEVLKNAKYPVQGIYGKEDKLIEISQNIGQSRLNSINFVSIYEDCSHMSMLETPARLAADINEFVSYCYKL